ncbi:hypothetical protein [Rhizorhabdus sp. FW153]|uniref:hypothetical protein n=1 Tax=Rhizorhabdus sp. FW153 TaxID=3400216 RepID=UPI003CF9D89F
MVKKSTARETEPASKAPPTGGRTRAHPMITGLSDRNMGLKIGVRYDDRGLAGFLPIIGWATVGNYIEAGTAALTPVIKGAGNQPTLASAATVKGYVGLFPIDATVADITADPGTDRPV